MSATQARGGKILVTPRSVTRHGHPALKRLEQAGYEVVLAPAGRQPDAEDLQRLLPGCVGYLAGVEEIRATVLESATALRVISRNGVGVDNIDLAAAARRGIVVHKAVGSNARGVAELTFAQLLALARWLPFGDRGIKAGGWERRQGIELIGRTLGLLGCGHVGRIVAKLALAFEMKVIAYDVMPDRSFAPAPDFRFAAFDEVLAAADALSLHCPALPDGRPLLGAVELARMKPGALLINTARADLVDGAALVSALERGHLAGVALDVFQHEPPVGDLLVASDRVVATPHIGGFTAESVDRAMEMAVTNLLVELESRNSRHGE